MLYEFFTYPKMLLSIALRYSSQGCEVRAYKEQKEGEIESKYKPNIFLDYSLEEIVHAFIVPIDWSFHIKKQIDLKREKANFYQNEKEMLD